MDTVTQIKFPATAVGATAVGAEDLNHFHPGGCECCLEIGAIIPSLAGMNLV